MTSKVIKITFLKEIQMLTGEYIIDYFLLRRCQNKPYEQGYYSYKICMAITLLPAYKVCIKMIFFKEMAGHQK